MSDNPQASLSEQILHAQRLRLACIDVMGKVLSGHEEAYALRPAILASLRTLTDKGDAAGMREALSEAWELLKIAQRGLMKMGLEGCGSDALPHELRMFALHFSPDEVLQLPGGQKQTGDGRLHKWREAYKAALSTPREPQAEQAKCECDTTGQHRCPIHPPMTAAPAATVAQAKSDP